MEKKSTSLVDFIADIKKQGASDKEVRKSFYKYIEMTSRKKAIPLHGCFELTPLCNLECKMCYVRLKETEFKTDKLISVNEWKGIIKEAHNAGMMYSTLTGGECLTYPGFEEVYLFLHSIGSVPCVLTNGLLLDKERIDFFKRFPPYHIQVTLYGSSNDAYEKVTGRRVFDDVYHNLEMVKEAQLKVSLAITPSSYMEDDFSSLINVAEALSIPFGINANLVTPRDNTGRELKDISVDQYIELYKLMKKEELVPIDPMELPDESSEYKPILGLQCGGGRSGFTIQYNGKMSPCPSLSELTTEPFREGFLNAWRRLNNLANNYPMPGECTECIYKEYCLYCPAIHNNAHNPGHRDPRICERTKRLIQEGFMQPPKE